MTIRVVHKRPGFPAEVVLTEADVEAFNGLLDGGFLAAVRISPEVHAYVDDEGLLKELPLNFLLYGEPIVGPAIFSKVNGEGEDVGFSEAEALDVAKRLNTGAF